MKRILSGIQPTGIPHLGNYLGAIQPWIQLQHQYDTYISVVDLHAITVPFEPVKLQQQITQMGMMLIAAGLDPSKVVLFRQSKIHQHTELGWFLFCHTPLSWLTRMHQYQTKSTKNPKLGLLSYPVLQAADILLYDADIVPVGQDQLQHMNLTIQIAKSINNQFPKLVKVPKTHLSPSKKIMSLIDPTTKMSKSNPSPKSRIELTDTDADIMMKIKKATTDSIPGITYDPIQRPGITNLLEIYFAFHPCENMTQKTIELFSNMKTSEFKEVVAMALIKEIQPIRSRYYELDSNQMTRFYEQGEEKAAMVASKTLERIYKQFGLL